jgi:hypothetical protein
VHDAGRHDRVICNDPVHVVSGKRPDSTGSLLAHPHQASGERAMLDLFMLGLTAGFFALAWAYVRACDHI